MTSNTARTALRSGDGTCRTNRRRASGAALGCLTILALVAGGNGTAAAAPLTPTTASVSADRAGYAERGIDEGTRIGAAPAAAAGVASASAAPMLSAGVGKLTATGCAGTGAVTCDLWAKTGTATVLGTGVPIWGFAGAVDGIASAPGPVLVVHQGDGVTITVHNQINGQKMSLALPGQAAVASDAGPGDDLSGVATGASRSYSFTASRPGTFLYEAGHTPDGARQVAMGLAGALIVLPADGTAYGTTGTAYDDDAVLVLGEIDPALNADPVGFDMRNFSPKYRTFNGKPYPEAAPVSTDQGHKVLMRYINVGSASHAMTVLGGDQVEIAQDGHLSTYSTTVSTDTVEPGATLDTVVTMPSGPEAKLAVYEPAMHLDNNGEHTTDPLQFAFGGMLTFLDTNAPPPSKDLVGPVSSHVSAAPNPSNARDDVTVIADLSDATTGGSIVTRAEFVIDDAVTTAVGFGVAMTATFGTTDVSGARGTIPAVSGAPCPAAGLPPAPALNCLSAGKHTIYVRAMDAAGNWGVIGSTVLNLPKTGPQTTNGTAVKSPANGATDVHLSATGDDTAAGGTIVDAEYFMDTPAADGSGVSMTRNRTATVVSEDATISAVTIKTLTEGKHHLLVHSKDSLGLWGPTLDVPLAVDLTGPGVDAASVAPNPTNGVLTSKSNPGYLTVSAQFTDKDAGGAPQSTLTAAEAFLDPKVAVPPGGSGLQLIAVDGKFDATTEAAYGLLPISQIRALAEGAKHTVFVRGQDAAGNWGPLTGADLVVDRTAPALSGTLTGTPNPTNGAANLTLTAPIVEKNNLATAEFWIGPADPGVGKATRISVGLVRDPAGDSAVATVPLDKITPGSYTFNLRVQDTAGNWSNKLATTPVTVTRPNLIFGSNFEPTDPKWSATTPTPPRPGPVSFAGTFKMPSPAEPGSTQGMGVTLAGGRNNIDGYVTDNSPAAETGYHARFVFDPKTLTSGTNASSTLTLFDGKTGNNSSAFAIQFHRTAAGLNQIRSVFSPGVGQSVNRPWSTLTTGQHTIQLDWIGGPATPGPTGGSLVLKVDGNPVDTFTGNTASLKLETVRLGVIGTTNTTTGGSSGAAWFDSFLSTRFTLP